MEWHESTTIIILLMIWQVTTLTGYVGDDMSLLHDVWFLPFLPRYKGLLKRKNILVQAIM